MREWLVSTISPGQFPTEYAVGGVQFDNKPFSLFAPVDSVHAPPNGEGPGLVRVEVIDRKGDLVLVRLPGPTLENGQYVTVKASDLQPARATENAAP